MKKAMLITVGNTADPILKALEDAGAEGGEVTAFLLYGRPFPGQNPSPFDVAHEASQKGEAMGFSVRLLEVANPEDLDICLAVSRDALREAADADLVVVNFTGGTKALSSAAVHAALTEPLSGKLVLDYTGGGTRDSHGRVLREAMRVVQRTATDDMLQQVLDRLRRESYREARLLAGRLPERGKAGFVKQAVEALYLWDEFDYEAAVQILRGLHKAAPVLSDDERLLPLIALVTRLMEPGNHLYNLVPILRKVQQGQGGLGKSKQHFPLLVADALQNSLRRLREERATDSVLRSYRAVEVAVQSRLLQNGVNPWKPDWQTAEEETKQRFLTLLKPPQLPRNLSLSTGLKMLEVMGQKLGEEIQKRLDDIQQLRNASYLEHGYQRLNVEDAKRLNDHAAALCAELLGDSLETARVAVRHSW